MPTTYRQFRDVAIGIVLVWVDIRIGGFDVLPDLLGYALMALGLVGVARRHPAFALAALMAAGLGLNELYSIVARTRVPISAIGLGGLPLRDTAFAPLNWSFRTATEWTLLYAYNILITFGLQRFFSSRGDLTDTDGVIRLRHMFIYTSLFTLLAGASALALPMLATGLLIPALVWQLVSTVSLVKLLLHAARVQPLDAFLAHLLAPEPVTQRRFFSLSPTARWIAGGTLFAYTLVVWWYMMPCSWLDIAVGKSGCAALIEQPNGLGAGVAVSPDNRFVVTNGGGQVREVNIASGRVTSQWGDDRSSDVSGVALAPDGTTIAAAQPNGIVVWRDGAHIADIRVDGGDDFAGTRTLAFAPDGASLAAADDTGTISIWRTSDGAVLQRLSGLDAVPTTLQFSTRGTVVAASKRRIAEWRVDDGASVQILDLPLYAPSLAMDNKGETYAIVVGNAIEQRSISTGEVVRRFNIANADLDAIVAFSPDDQTLAVWSDVDGNAIALYRVANGERIGTLRVPGTPLLHFGVLRWSRDSRMLAASGLIVLGYQDSVAVWRIP